MELNSLKKEKIIFHLNSHKNLQIKRFWVNKYENDWRLIIQLTDLNTFEISQVRI